MSLPEFYTQFERELTETANYALYEVYLRARNKRA